MYTSTMFVVVARERWHWPRLKVAAIVGLFFTIDVAFLGANLVKIEHGGWFPLSVGGYVWSSGIVAIMLMSIVVGLLPALRAQRLKIVDALAGR